MTSRIRIERNGAIFVDGIALPARLSDTEARIAETILRHRAMMTVEEIMAATYRLEVDWPSHQIVSVFVCKIRKKLGPHAGAIRNVWGRGFEAGADYALEPAAATASISIPAELATSLAETAHEADITADDLAAELLGGALPAYRRHLWAA